MRVMLPLVNTTTAMRRSAGPLLACVLALANTRADAQAGATPAITEAPQAATTSEAHGVPAPPSTADDICHALEQSAAENSLPVEFFARVIWQESRFDALAVSRKGAAGIAQFMPATASWHGLADPFDPIEALRHSAAYLRELLNQFGNLGLAAAAYNAGPGRVSAWLTSHRALPAETRNYVALVTGWTADEWASSTPPEKAEISTRRTMHTACQSDPCTETRAAARRYLHTALGHSSSGPFV
jgi:soluble lytic murein transglycosylase-like protein